ncbi:MAG: PKD domain-containing protein [Flavobacteriales bacterium]|nr:PKD domain-containing protein [Flavobacteriales bacterium]
MSGLNGFERAVKEALEPYEVPYNSADWSHLERALDGRSDDVARVSRSGLYALLLGGSLAAASSFFVLVSPDTAPANVGLAIIAPAELHTPTLPEKQVTTPVADEEPENALPPTAHTASTATPTRTAATDAQSSAASTPERVVPVHPMSNEPLVRPSITEGCPGSVIDFQAENLSEKGMYLWNFGDGSFSNKPKPSHVFSKAGNFEVTLSHSTSAGGSIRNEAVADRIIIHEAPEASFSPLKQEYDNTVPSVHFENRSLGGKTYLWDFGDGSTSTVAHPDHVYKKAGLYTVSLTVVNGKGCEDRAERTVRIDADYDLFAPKVFSPNGDGVDDLFIPEALKTLGVRFHLSIFEPRTGVLVYETTDPQRPWNGRVGNKGDASPAGDYVWMVEMKDGEKLGGTYNGSIQLVR